MDEYVDLHVQDKRLLKETVLDEMRARDLYRPDLIFRGFPREFIPFTLESGYSREYETYCIGNPEDTLKTPRDPSHEEGEHERLENPLSFAWNRGALAVYRGDKLRLHRPSLYKFIDWDARLEALVIVFSIRPKVD